jgi:hypothetical protein
MNLKRLIVNTLLVLALCACARSNWVKKAGKANKVLERPFVVFKGPSVSRGYFGEMEKAFQREAYKHDIRPSYQILETGEKKEEKAYIVEQCAKMRCDHVVLMFLTVHDEAPDSTAQADEDKSTYYKLNNRIFNAETNIVDWEAELDLDNSEVEGLELSNSMYAESAVKEILSIWKKEGLVRK